jgi:hypothetical protein
MWNPKRNDPYGVQAFTSALPGQPDGRKTCTEPCTVSSDAQAGEICTRDVHRRFLPRVPFERLATRQLAAINLLSTAKSSFPKALI